MRRPLLLHFYCSKLVYDHNIISRMNQHKYLPILAVLAHKWLAQLTFNIFCACPLLTYKCHMHEGGHSVMSSAWYDYAIAASNEICSAVSERLTESLVNANTVFPVTGRYYITRHVCTLYFLKLTMSLPNLVARMNRRDQKCFRQLTIYLGSPRVFVFDDWLLVVTPLSTAIWLQLISYFSSVHYATQCFSFSHFSHI